MYLCISDWQKAVELISNLDQLEAEVESQSTFYREVLTRLTSVANSKIQQVRVSLNKPTTINVILYLDSLICYISDLNSIIKNYFNWFDFDILKFYYCALNCIVQPTIAVLLIACNREEAVRRSLDLLLKYRPSQQHFPITVSQDCGHPPTKDAILSYGDQVTLIEVCQTILCKLFITVSWVHWSLVNKMAETFFTLQVKRLLSVSQWNYKLNFVSGKNL